MTSVAALGVLLACSAITVATVMGWALAALVSALSFERRFMARTRALLFAQARLLPLACAALLVPAQISAFVRYEAGGGESAGVLLWTTAATGVALALQAVWSAASSWRDTARVIREWSVTATPLLIAHWPRRAWLVRRPSPIVAVAGVFRPQLFVDRQVVTSCTADELSAITAHEAAHVAARDNLIRLLFRLTPGAPMFRRLAVSLERKWAAAAEEAADSAAVRSTSAIDLASALTKVARLEVGGASAPLAASTLIGDGDLSSRVQRLLRSSAPTRHHAIGWMPAVGLIAAAVLAQAAPVSAAIHELFESLVRHGG
jgi:beta-lactamase regulating signal transducer with metallopeptidase domain